ncbi:D-lactate dehydrogenase (cytochrome) [Scopulibacillus darangshiensis]|uniref:D-lactate dehydrogenase (cytochrome) n=1 Tax=Scopulibacillus darangshiensis TaxID=442528 RepID=A0A4R2P8T1_9BACL|nr:FAD-linked oxidase C-terminal domain-containing protein [Scopulibacillus darangshiensis]TCP31277.1 D-lactate dehydrogenase (cytochrome) [Scopulibacillus darangshiensis]
MQLLTDLRSIIKDDTRVTANETVINNHGQDLTYHQPSNPDLVVFPKTMEEVQQVVVYAHKNNIPVVPYGAGSSLEGHAIPIKGGISLDFTEMNKIVEVRPDDFIVKVEPGVTRRQLNKHLKRYGLFFPVDPGADASMGGMAATNASGTNTVKYGAMRQNVLGLEVVLADGKIIRTGGMSFKTSAGYDLKDLFVGSEGTLGVFTEITLKLTGIPEVIQAGKAVFKTVEEASQAAENILKAGIRVARMELVDEKTIEAVNKFSDTDYIESPSLFLEFDGSKAAVEEDIRFTKEIIDEAGCVTFQFETDEKARNLLWHARHEAALSVVNLVPGKRLTSSDVCVPISELSQAISDTRRLVDTYHFQAAAVFGHVGDGNFHVLIGIDPNDAEEVAAYKDLNRKIVAYALERGGTCTGEHGIGMGKREFLRMEHGAAVDVMGSIKRALDPENILNPGKIF